MLVENRGKSIFQVKLGHKQRKLSEDILPNWSVSWEKFLTHTKLEAFTEPYSVGIIPIRASTCMQFQQASRTSRILLKTFSDRGKRSSQAPPFHGGVPMTPDFSPKGVGNF